MDPTRHRQDGVQAYMRSAQDRPGCRSSGSWLELFSARPTWPRSTNPNHLWGPRQLRSSTLRFARCPLPALQPPPFPSPPHRLWFTSLLVPIGSCNHLAQVTYTFAAQSHHSSLPNFLR
ncbi:hypothetical protein FJTKL_15284 [Diaporthe vaccinii]|uniref:Uncharacterized protein n=1 Tax=Diaporthe vaccinii TaxID=105482 RepID=A0ABR4E5I2_9PEZI